MRVLQLPHFARKIAAVTGLAQQSDESRNVDVAYGFGAVSEALAGVRGLRRRQDATEGAVEGDPVAHEVPHRTESLPRSPLYCKAKGP